MYENNPQTIGELKAAIKIREIRRRNVCESLTILRDVCKCAFNAEKAIWRTFWKFCGKIIHRLKFKSTKFEGHPVCRK